MADERAREDRRLAEQLSAGDADALESLYDAHAGAIYRQALAVLGGLRVLNDVFLAFTQSRRFQHTLENQLAPATLALC